MAKLKESSTIEGVPIATQNDLNTIESKVSDGKSVLANAIFSKGVNANPTDTFQQLADKIMDIPVSDGTDIKFATGSGYSGSGGKLQVSGLNFVAKTILYYDDFDGVFALYSEELNVNISGEHKHVERVIDGDVFIGTNGFSVTISPLSTGNWIAFG